MLTVKTRLGPSAIEGIGLFADEDIPQGTVTWRYMPGYDRLFTTAEIAALPEPARSNLLNHLYRDDTSGTYVFCLDNAHFMNHAADPNTAGVHANGAIEGYDVATRDICKGEEMTCDYRTFDADYRAKLGNTSDRIPI
jgi:uncharacterized protein